MLRWLLLAVAILAVSDPAAPAFARALEMADDDIAQLATPAVVNISIWRLRPVAKEGEAPRRMKAHGSGFIIDPGGLIVTNRHVIDGAIDILITLSNGSRVHGTLVGTAAMADLAVLKVSVATPLPFLRWGDSNQLRVGSRVLKIGNPLGVGMSVSAGIVSGLDRDLQDTPFDSFIQTDAAMNNGDSGGPLLDRFDEVVGVNTSLFNTDPNGGSIGIGFAIPSAAARFIVTRVLDPNRPKPGWVGLKLQDMTPELADAFGLQAPRGSVVVDIDPGGPAAQTLLRPGDVLEGLDATSPIDARSFMRAIAMLPVGQQTTLMILRNGNPQTVAVTVADWPSAATRYGTAAPNLAQASMERPLDLGLTLEPNADGHGVLVAAVEWNCEAGELGVAAGDVILSVQGLPVTTPADVTQALAHAQEQHRNFAALLVQGKGGKRWISFSIGAVSG